MDALRAVKLALLQAAVGSVFDLVEGRAAELAAAAGLQAGLSWSNRVMPSSLRDTTAQQASSPPPFSGLPPALASACLQAEAQRQLAGELTGLLDSSKGIRSAVDVVIGYQQRSDSGGQMCKQAPAGRASRAVCRSSHAQLTSVPFQTMQC